MQRSQLALTVLFLSFIFRPAVQMRGTLAPGAPWDVVVDLFFYREPEEAKEEGEDAAADAFGGVPDAGYGGAAGLPAPPGAHPQQSAVTGGRS